MGTSCYCGQLWGGYSLGFLLERKLSYCETVYQHLRLFLMAPYVHGNGDTEKKDGSRQMLAKLRFKFS